MEACKSIAECVFNLDKAVALFDQVFSDIASTRSHNVGDEIDYRINRTALTDKQCSAVKEIAGFMDASIKASESLRVRSGDYLELAAVRTPWLEYNADNKPKAVANVLANKSIEKQLAIVTEYLVLEMCRSEDFGFKVTGLEEKLVAATNEITRLQKKLSLHDTSQRDVEAEQRRAAVQALEDHAKCGDTDLTSRNCFIQKQFGEKKFFGLVATFNDPWFGVSILVLFSSFVP